MRFFTVLWLMLTVAWPAKDALADVKAMKILKNYEKKYSNYKALYVKMKLYVQGQHKATMESRNRPSGQRLLKLLYPGDVKGMQILVQSQSEMYIYLPAFRKVRRIAGHVRNQGFLGSGFTYDDMSIAYWSKSYTVRLQSETPKHWTVDLKARPGKSALYRHLRIRIRKDIGYADRFLYFNRHGKNYKTQKFLRYDGCTAAQAHCNPNRIEMIEHSRGNRKSVLKNVKTKYKKRYSDRVYTIRYLLRSAN